MDTLPQDILGSLSTYTGIPDVISNEIKINDEQKERYIKLWCTSLDIEYNDDASDLWPLYQEYQSIHKLLPKTLITAIGNGLKNKSLLRWYINSNSSTTVYYHILDLVKCINANFDEYKFYSITCNLWSKLKYERDIPFVCEIISECLIMKNLNKFISIVSLLEYKDFRLYHVLLTSTSMYFSKEVNITDFTFVDNIMSKIFDFCHLTACANIYAQARYFAHYELSNYIYDKYKEDITIHYFMDGDYDVNNEEEHPSFREFNLTDMLERDDYEFFAKFADYDCYDQDEYVRLMNFIVKALESTHPNAMRIFKLFYKPELYGLVSHLEKFIVDSDIDVLTKNLKTFGEYYGQEHLSNVIISTLFHMARKSSNTSLNEFIRLQEIIKLIIVPSESKSLYEHFVKYVPNRQPLWNRLFNIKSNEQ